MFARVGWSGRSPQSAFAVRGRLRHCRAACWWASSYPSRGGTAWQLVGSIAVSAPQGGRAPSAGARPLRRSRASGPAATRRSRPA